MPRRSGNERFNYRVSGNAHKVTSLEESARNVERIAEEYEEDAALPGPEDPQSLLVRVRKLEERMATLEEYLGEQSARSSSP